MNKRTCTLSAILAIVVLLAPQLALAVRTQLKPGWNLISRQQDVQLGREAAAEAERQLPLVRDSALNNYVSTLGKRLARFSPAADYPYTFKIIGDRKINAFALPGGPVYINLGVITSAQNEAQLAGVLAHEIGHVALRHGTSNASKAMLAQMPLAILGGVIGSGSVLGQLAQLGIGFGLNSVFLKYSRDAERQADILAAQMLFDAGYDAEEMAKFFEAMARGEKGRSVEWLSSHPSPGNRTELVRAEIRNLGAQKTAVDYGPGFPEAKARAGGSAGNIAQSRPPSYGHEPSGPHTHPSYPSGNMRTLDAGVFRVSHPDNWQVFGQDTSALSIAPREGVSNAGLAYGMMVSFFEPDPGDDGRITLGEATTQLIEQLRQSNQGLRLISGRQRMNVDNLQGLSVMLMGRSPVRGENETDWLVTAMRPDGTLWYAVFVAPERDFNSYRPTFEQMLSSVRFTR